MDEDSSSDSGWDDEEDEVKENEMTELEDRSLVTTSSAKPTLELVPIERGIPDENEEEDELHDEEDIEEDIEEDEEDIEEDEEEFEEEEEEVERDEQESADESDEDEVLEEEDGEDGGEEEEDVEDDEELEAGGIEEQGEDAERDDEELLNPLMMIDSQPGQGITKGSMFGTRGEEIFTKRKRQSRKKKKKPIPGSRRIPKQIQTMIGRATQHHVDREYDEAIALCYQISQQNSRLPDPFHLLATIFFDRGDKEKELNALQMACERENTMNIGNFERIAELGLELGRDPKLGTYEVDCFNEDFPANEEGDGQDENKGSDEGKTDSSDQTSKKYSLDQRQQFLRTAEDAIDRVLRRTPNLELVLLRGEILENLGDYKRAADAYKRQLKRCFDAKELNLQLVLRLARAYRLRKKSQKCEAILEKYVPCVLYPLPDMLPTFRKQALTSETERNRRENERRRRTEALRNHRESLKRKGKAQDDSGLDFEQRISEAIEISEASKKRKSSNGAASDPVNRKKLAAQARKRRRMENKRKAAANEEAEQDEEQVEFGMENFKEGIDDEEEEEEEEDEEQMLQKAINAEREQLEAGINVLSMYVEILIEKEDHLRALGFLERFLEFIKDGLCSNMMKNQWQYWEHIQPKLNVDLCQILVICYIRKGDFRTARNYMHLFENIELNSDTNSRLIRFEYEIAEAWTKQSKYVTALELFERLITITSLKLVLRVDAYSRAAFCCECIDYQGTPERAAATAGGKAIGFLKKLLDLLTPKLTDPRYRDLQETKDITVQRLDRMLRKAGKDEEANALLADQAANGGRTSDHRRPAHDAIIPPPPPSSSSNIHSAPLPASPLLSRSFERGERDRAALKQKKAQPTSIPVVSPFTLKSATPSPSMPHEMVEKLDIVHAAYLEGAHTTCVRLSLPLLAGFFRERKKTFVQLVFQVQSILGDMEEGNTDRKKETDESIETALAGITDESVTVQMVENDYTLRFVQEWCVSLMSLGHAEVGVAFLKKIIPRRRKGIKGDVYKGQAQVLFTGLCLVTHDFDSTSKALMDVTRRARDAMANERGSTWGDEISILWEVLNGVLCCMRWGIFSSEVKAVMRRLERLTQSVSGARKDESRMQSYGLSMLTAHQQVLMHNPVKALSNYFIARNLSHDNPLVALCIATCYLRLSNSRSAEDRNNTIMKAFAHLQDYQQKRASMGSTPEEKAAYLVEIYYNFGRLAQQIGFPVLVDYFYRKALDVPDANLRDKRETAYNYMIFHKGMGNMDLAKSIAKEYLVM